MIGRTVSHYRVLAPLGAGGMGVVYEAEDTRLRRRVALKFLPSEALTSPARLERFRREAEAASALNHPHICTIFDIGEADGAPFIVMEKLEGESLEQMLRRGPVSVDRMLEIGAQVADALAAAHDARIIHRDVKPANIFLTSRGHAKLLDFGLARLDPADSGEISGDVPTVERHSALTVPGTTLGTVAYMAPEQARGDAVDARSDVFSLGVVLYEMATGQLPFRGATMALIVDALLNRQPVPPSELNRSVSPALERVVLDTLEKNRDLRTQSAAELRAALQRLQRGSDGAVSATAPSVAPRRTFGVPLALGTAAVLVVAVAVAVLFFRSDRGREPAGYAARPPLPAGSPAEEAYLRGRYHMQRDQLDEAIAAFEDAARLEPERGAVWAALANAYSARTYLQGDRDAERKAFVAVERGLRVDPDRAELYTARANLLWTRANGFPHAQALRDLRRAIDLDPNDGSAHAAAARILQHVGLQEEADEEAARALAIEPANLILRIGVGWGHFYARRCEAALTTLEQFRNEAVLPVVLDCVGRTAEGAALAEALVRDPPDPAWESMNWGVAAFLRARRGDRSAAREAIGKAVETGREVSHFHHTAHLVAVAHALLGENEAAIDWLERASREGFPALHVYAVDPHLAAVREDERFKRLAKRIADEQRELRAIFR